VKKFKIWLCESFILNLLNRKFQKISKIVEGTKKHSSGVLGEKVDLNS
jgi:hypothetical protein